jgi:hypothetical protein
MPGKAEQERRHDRLALLLARLGADRGVGLVRQRSAVAFASAPHADVR